jgi:DNA repair protein RecO (recombination protein O)
MARPERIYRTQAIILRRYDFSEADRLLTLYTQASGKIRAIAKGARKMNSRQLGHVELFTRSNMLIALGRELHVVSQAEMVESFLPLHEDLERGAYANYIAELVENFSEFDEQNTGLFDLLNHTLGWLSAPEVDLMLCGRYFELHLLRLVGFLPSLFHCAIGQEDLEPHEHYYFGVFEGGVVCAEHVNETQKAHVISLNALKLLRYMLRNPYPVVARLRIDAPLHMMVERVLQAYIVHILEKRLKSVDFIRRLRRLD